MKLLIIAVMSLFSALPVFAEDVLSPAKLYEKGIEAYKEDDHINALKYLFAYKVVKGSKLAPSANEELEKAIEFSEKSLRMNSLQRDLAVQEQKYKEIIRMMSQMQQQLKRVEAAE